MKPLNETCAYCKILKFKENKKKRFKIWKRRKVSEKLISFFFVEVKADSSFNLTGSF